MDHRNVYAILEQDSTDDDIDNFADQRLESSMEIESFCYSMQNQFVTSCRISLLLMQNQFVTQCRIKLLLHAESVCYFMQNQFVTQCRINLLLHAESVCYFMENQFVTQCRINVTPRPTTTPTTAATAPAEMDHRPVNPVDPVGRPIPQAPTSSTSSMALLKNIWGPCRQLKTAKVTQVTNGRITIGYDERHWAAPLAEQHSALVHDIGHVVPTYCPMRWKSWKMLEEANNTVRNHLWTNYNFDDINDDMLAYLNRLFSKRYKQWKSDLHQYFEMFDDPQVILEEGCSNKFEDRQDSWVWLCGHFQESGYVKAKVNKINREKKTLLLIFFYFMRVQNSWRLTSLLTFMFGPGMS
ncbi:uncharacterized protein [Malus domestica]|uniref:uncharacterized protein n=1 Tax=Malus domestica TaxID=3750 RepID=UPI003976B0BB